MEQIVTLSMHNRLVTLFLSFPIADLLLDRIKTESALLTEPQIGPPPLQFTCAAHPCCRMATDELSAISKQLHSQAQVTNIAMMLCFTAMDWRRDSLVHLEM